MTSEFKVDFRGGGGLFGSRVHLFEIEDVAPPFRVDETDASPIQPDGPARFSVHLFQVLDFRVKAVSYTNECDFQRFHATIRATPPPLDD